MALHPCLISWYLTVCWLLTCSYCYRFRNNTEKLNILIFFNQVCWNNKYVDIKDPVSIPYCSFYWSKGRIENTEWVSWTKYWNSKLNRLHPIILYLPLNHSGWWSWDGGWVLGVVRGGRGWGEGWRDKYKTIHSQIAWVQWRPQGGPGARESAGRALISFVSKDFSYFYTQLFLVATIQICLTVNDIFTMVATYANCI